MLFVPIKFKTNIHLTPAELDSTYQERIYEKLRSLYEGKCTKYGYIKPHSIEIVKRSCGNFVKQNFNGSVKFDMICRGEVCNPIQGSIVKATVKNKNQLGILAESTMELDAEVVPILDIIIPIKSAGIISQINLDTLSIGDTITVEVMGKKYQMKDTKISIIGRVITQATEEAVPIIEEQIAEEDNDDIVDIQEVAAHINDDDEEEEKKKVPIDDEEDEESEEESEAEDDPIYEGDEDLEEGDEFISEDVGEDF